mmetsp:Transcript_7663/g.15981  ORF Transcript_7663/g.15981 Transcript_7663/m.15981 type:complete len:238 (-) Transcript_7663:89-802(-)
MIVRQCVNGYARRGGADMQRVHVVAARYMSISFGRRRCSILRCHGIALNNTKSALHPPINKTYTVNKSIIRRSLSEIGRGGADLLGADALSLDGQRKIVLDSYMPTGFDVLGMLDHAEDYNDEDDEKLKKSPVLHVNGSMIAFPTSFFLWNVDGPKDVTLESLSLVIIRDPSVEFLFIGCNHTLPPREMNRIRREMKEKGIVVEQLDLTNAMGTFNILNGEDRRVACALVLDKTEPV